MELALFVARPGLGETMGRRSANYPTSASDTLGRQSGSALLLALAMTVLVNASDQSGSNHPTYIVPVEAGRARVTFATPGPGSKSLVVVTPMSRNERAHSIRLETEAATGPVSRLAPFSVPAAPSRPQASDLRRNASRGAPPPASHRRFWLLVRDGDPRNAANYRPVEARLRAVGRGIQIYVDEASQSQVSDEKLRMLIHTFDEVIEPRCTARFGPVADVDHDGRLTVLLTAALSELARQVGPVDGLMRGADFDTRVPTPLGNQSDVLFLNARVPAGGYLQSILAHEYAHAIIFSRRVLDEACKQPGCEEESWLDEGLAHLVEASFGFSRDNLDYRLDSFLADPENYRLVVDDYYSSRLFRSHGHRGASYLFLDWCLTHFGPGLLDVLMRSRDSGVDNLEHATATRFDDLYRAWSVALFLQSTASGQACDRVPRHTTLDPGDGEMWRGVATASHYSIVHGSSTGAVHLTITTDADADLQVTLVALPDDLPTLALRVDASPTSAVAQLRTHDAGWVVIDGFDTMPREVKPATRTSWQAVDCEIPTQPLAPASRRNVALRLPAQWERAGTMWVRVRGHDALGRPVVAWATLAGAPVR